MDHFRLLIVGAGASGIAAGARLLENKFMDFKILEAENRIGGRVFTTSLDDTTIELGAEWIHGESGNIVFKLASENNLADNSRPKFDFLKTRFFDISGQQINADISKALLSAYHEIFKSSKTGAGIDEQHDSLGKYFEDEMEKVIAELRKGLYIDDNLFKKFIKSLEIWQNSIDGSHSWYQTSLRGDAEYWECEGNGLTRWKNNSYSTIFNLLTGNRADIHDKILLNKEVTKIKWNKNGLPTTPKVVVECQDGTVYHGDYLLLTCSLGVLKEKHNFFYPSLPEKKTKCILGLGFGTVDKIFIKFKECWWGPDFDGCGFLWSEDERNDDSSHWISDIFGFHPIGPTVPVLRGWITGEAAKLMETLSENEILTGLNYLLNKFLGSTYKVPPIQKYMMSRWFLNPHFRGSYSCRYLESERENVWAADLAEAVCDSKGNPVLLFGGEATHDHYYSTVHGAIEAGYREADRFLQNCLANEKEPVYYKVAIVGAGISGLAAAKTLKEKGIDSFIILEAQSEPGGRIRSVPIDDYYIELGAQWIHGTKNEVFTISQANGLLAEESSPEGQGLFLRENSDKIDVNILEEVEYVVNEILEKCEEYVDAKTFPRSVGDELFHKFNTYLNNCTSDSEEQLKIKKELFNWHVKFNLIDNSCSDLCNLSAKAWGLFQFCGGNDYVNFKNGYSSFVDFLVKILPENSIRYNSIVDHIYWRKSVTLEEKAKAPEEVKIITRDGFVVYCQYVIVTASLGYLKNHHESMFTPHLPRYLSKAIESLGFGVLDKIFLIYEKPWWESQTKGFQLVWADEELEDAEGDWTKYITGFDVIFKDKPVLLGWIAGDGAMLVEDVPEEEIGITSTNILRQFTGNQSVPFPVKVIRTKWYSNEFVKGAYSHIPVNCDKDNITCSSLARPAYSSLHTDNDIYEKPTIFLAGEATHGCYFSTVHGAYETGKSQAKVIVKDLRIHRT